MSERSITLGELVGKLDMLEVACHRCDRKGRLKPRTADRRAFQTNFHEFDGGRVRHIYFRCVVRSGLSVGVPP
jgi:hypothetical protein